MRVAEIAPGLWRWTAPHPGWSDAEEWPQDVGCVYYEAPDAVVLIDPLVPAEERERERFFRALDADVERLGRPVAILLTVARHSRSADELAERYGATRAPAPRGVVGLPVPELDETVYWLPEHLALVVGDALVGDGEQGLVLGKRAEETERESLLGLLELPVERVLTAHGEPVLGDGLAALARALRA